MLNRIVAFVLLIIALPVCLVVYILIYIFEGGSPIFVQSRCGLYMRKFNIYKFRTMKLSTKNIASHEVPSSQLIKIGKFLRTTKLDEILQLINVMKGDMNFIGPRPCLPSQFDVIEARKKHSVFDIKPGITGLAQIGGIDMSKPNQLAEIDGCYREKQSLRLDLHILVKTFTRKSLTDRTG